ncbi:MAG: response regulator [Candidatus Omnitrophota bacterium]|jgi:CheY-like chemotaxis protein
MPKTILVVDDEPDVMKFAVLRLEKAGYNVLTAVDGAAAIEAAVSGHPDLILLDIKLPKMSGYEVFKQMRARPDLAAIPVILVTADASVSIARHTVELKAEDHILKPYNAEELFEKIRRHIR